MMKGKPVTIDLRDAELVPDANVDPVRGLLYLVFLIALKDRASEVYFEPVQPGEVFPLERPPWWKPDGEEQPPDSFTVPPSSEWQGCRLTFRAGGIMYDMVPSPFGTVLIASEVAALARFGFPYHPLRPFFHLLHVALCL